MTGFDISNESICKELPTPVAFNVRPHGGDTAQGASLTEIIDEFALDDTLIYMPRLSNFNRLQKTIQNATWWLYMDEAMMKFISEVDAVIMKHNEHGQLSARMQETLCMALHEFELRAHRFEGSGVEEVVIKLAKKRFHRMTMHIFSRDYFSMCNSRTRDSWLSVRLCS